MRDEGRFEWQGRHIAWSACGAGAPVVFCHGTPWSSALWEPFADALATDFRVYSWDMPGYGRSSKHSDHAVDLGVQGAAFTALLEHWRLDRPHVVAHDYGGAVALRARVLHDARMASLCLVDVVALRPWGSPFFTLVRDHAEVFAALPAAIHRGALDAYVRTASHRGLTDAQLDLLTAPWLGAEGQAAFYRQIAAADERFTEEVEHRLGDLDLPVHIVWGTADSWIPVDRAHRLQALIPGSTLRLVADAGHLIQFDAPVQLADDLRTWLTSS